MSGSETNVEKMEEEDERIGWDAGDLLFWIVNYRALSNKLMSTVEGGGMYEKVW